MWIRKNMWWAQPSDHSAQASVHQNINVWISWIQIADFIKNFTESFSNQWYYFVVMAGH